MSRPRFEVETVAGRDAIARRKALLAEGRGYPVIVGAPDNVDLVVGGHESAAGADACLEAVKGTVLLVGLSGTVR